MKNGKKNERETVFVLLPGAGELSFSEEYTGTRFDGKLKLIFKGRDSRSVVWG